MGVGCSRTGAIGVHEQRYECWELNSAPLPEQPGFLTAEARLQAKGGVLSFHPFLHYFFFIHHLLFLFSTFYPMTLKTSPGVSRGFLAVPLAGVQCSQGHLSTRVLPDEDVSNVCCGSIRRGFGLSRLAVNSETVVSLVPSSV